MTETQLTTLVRSVSKHNRQQLQTNIATILHGIAMPEDDLPRPTSAETRNADKMLKEDSNELSLINDPNFVADLERLRCGQAVSDPPYVYPSHTTSDIQAQLKLEADRSSGQDIREAGHSLIQKVNSLAQSWNSLFRDLVKTPTNHRSPATPCDSGPSYSAIPSTLIVTNVGPNFPS